VAELKPHARLGLVALALLWAVVVIPVGTHRGGDFTPEVAQSDRLLDGLPLYTRNPALGVWWPPFTALLLAPFALTARWAGMTLAKALWATVSAACVIWSVGRAGWTWGWAPALIAFGVLVAPIQNSFQHLQITTLLLALVVAAALDLQAGRERRAAVWIGGATAVKAFPALLLAYLAHQRRWRALAIGAGVAIILTVGAMLPYGVIGAIAAVRDWILLNGQAAGVGGLHMQKLARLGYDMGGSLPVIIAAELIIVGAVAYALRRRAQPEDALADIGMVTLLAVLLSPIASYYYFGLLFPAWVAALRGPIVADRRLWRAGLVLAAVLVSGLLGLPSYPASLASIPANNDTLGALILLALLLTQRLAPGRAWRG